MSIRNLNALFNPASVAVIGASSRPHSVGATVWHNLLAGGFKGPCYAVNPRHRKLKGVPVYASIKALPQAPELAIICTPPATVPQIISQLAARGTRAAVVLTAGLGSAGPDNAQGSGGRKSKSLKQQMLDAARPSLLRILGPNCVGMLVPGIGLNASFAHADALPGKLAFVSQSGALVTGVLDWARSRGIGFSKFISLGEGADVDFGDLLDMLASDSETHAILLYVEDIRAARKFMSAARAAARSKPVLILKVGRMPEGARAAASHTGAMAGSDDVYDAAIRRAGMLRVYTTEDLFSAVETLAHAHSLAGERLVILTNGGGPGVMATDALIDSGGRLAELGAATRVELDRVLPANWSHANPVDIIGDAPVERYVATFEALAQDPEIDALLFIHAPTAIVPSAEIARSLAPIMKAADKPVLSCWLGVDAVREARQLFSTAGLASYDTPEDAVRGFMQIVHYRRNQDLLMQVPAALPHAAEPDRAAARELIKTVLAAGRDLLSEPEAKRLLAAYGVPVVDTRTATSVNDAVACAQEIGLPVALKILSPQVTHKSDVDGVALDLKTADAVRAAALAMAARLAELRPDAQLQGFSVQAMARRPEAHELIVGVSTDAVFGPVILFGQGGVAVEVLADHAIGLPPLNMVLARDMIARTRVSRLLAGYRNRPAADVDAICRVLIQIGQLVTDIPEIAELDINPLWADVDGVLALDARVRVATPHNADRLAIRPYPAEWQETVSWHGETLVIRPIRPDDGAAHVEFFKRLTPEDIRDRFFGGLRELQLSQLARLTQIDYDREMAFIATRARSDGQTETIGVMRVICDPDNIVAEFGIIVRSDLTGHGLGELLMAKMIAYCKARGTQRMVGETFATNARLQHLVRHFGFVLEARSDAGIVGLRLEL